ncbi:MAG: hypothetical protein JNN25_06795 [Candidatus Kapabacteria bacterium]|nr:hypothetical protein [Candidatus Kapabacteria bacterium]
MMRTSVIRFTCAFLLVLVLPITSWKVFAQQKVTYSGRFLATAYSVDDGLPTNLVKDIQQDKQGFIWFATDAGLVRFDGYRFQTFVHNLPSPYVKALTLRKNGQLLAVTDLGIVEVVSSPDSVLIHTVIPGKQEEQEGVLHFPKEIFEAADGSLWFAEQQAVVRFRSGKLKRYHFPEKCHSRNAVVSFYFAEDSFGSLLLTANPGYCYRYNPVLDRFEEVVLGQNYGGFAHVQALGAGEVLIAAEKGILRLHLPAPARADSTQDTVIKPLRVSFTPLLSSVNRISALMVSRHIYPHPSGVISREVFVGTWYEGVFASDTAISSFVSLPNIEPQRVKNFFEDTSGSLWICGDQGVIVLTPVLARMTTGIEDKVPDIKSLVEAPDGTILTVTGQSAYQVHPTFTTAKRLFDKMPASGELFAVCADKQGGIWSGSLSGLLSYWKNGVVERSMMISVAGSTERGIFSLAEDNDGNIWGCFFNERASVFCVRKSGAVQYYGAERGINRIIQVIRKASDGTLYAGAIGTPNEYLFRYNASEDRFENISKPFESTGLSTITVNDIAVSPTNPRLVYCASSFGLITVDTEKASLLVFDAEFRGNVCKAIAVEKSGVIWLGTDLGLLRHFNGVSTLFHQSAGLRSRTIAYRGLMLDAKELLWVATTNGLYKFDCQNCRTQSRPPVFMQAIVNGQKISFDALPESFDSQSFIQLLFAPGYATAHNTLYQSRVYRQDAAKPVWSRSFVQPVLTLSNLEAGTYIVEITARNEGVGETWSKPLAMRFVIEPPIYRSRWAYLLYAVLTVVLVGFLVLIVITGRERRRIDEEARARIRLQKLVDDRTAEISRQKELLETQTMEIQSTNDELRHANEELQRFNVQMLEASNFKTKLLSMVSHDLKNPLGSLLGLSKIMESQAQTEDQQQIAQDMTSLAEQSLALVKDLLDSAAVESGKIELHKTSVDIGELITAIAWQYKPHAEKKQQVLVTSLEVNSHIEGDERRLWQVFENLVSNAIKYSPPEKTIWVTLERCPGDEASGTMKCIRFSVRDEGPGLTEDDKSKVFGHFQRLSAQPTGGESSSGVGLSIVKQIVELHGGRVWVESEAGKGATFIVQLPVAEA